MALPGRDVVVEVSPDGTTWSVVAEMNDFSFAISGNNIDVSKFTDDFVRRMQGLKDTSVSFSGFFDPTDTSGQVAIRAALLADSDLYVRIKPDGTAGWSQPVKVSSVEWTASADGAVETSVELEGDGTVSVV
jgi:predicted secreted protein